ncbi:MAG: RelA/SpoT family protein [Bacteroidetes bacterium HGW-Bacteroidetes-19]|nr:MAG: RelA/SpoT family protein [Bacteroidetes bacterium HGW-Bacteroidetes-19]
MDTYIPNEKLEGITILRKYRVLLSTLKEKTSKEERKKFRKAFALAIDAHKDMRRKSGEPYIYHPIAVAEIIAKEINLGTTSMIAALLHDVVEDTEYTHEDIKEMFGEEVANIVYGLTKIEDIVMDDNQSIQAENFKKILLYTVGDVRVILIKLADRLHNMRTLSSMPPEKQWKISSETQYFFVPIAHRLGLYSIKSQLEDLAMKYYDPIMYSNIAKHLKSSESIRKTLIEDFAKPIKEKLKLAGIEAEMTSREKSIYSIYQKMTKKKIDFENIYDIFAVRFVFDSPPEMEKDICWRIHTIITGLYKTNASRERNYLTNPKANGYQSLHVTAMSSAGKWIEVQIRSKRMDEIAEKGFAAHFKYKEENKTPAEYENRVEDWLTKIREMLKNDETNALEFLNEVKMNLELKEVVIFTPKGDRKLMPFGATVLDFAYQLHTNLGNHCIGAKVNYNIVSLNYVLKSGDQVEIITSKKQFPKAEWVSYVKTSHAKENIKEAIRNKQKKLAGKGQDVLKEIFAKLNIEYTQQNISKIQSNTKISSLAEFWSHIAEGIITEERIEKIFKSKKFSDYKLFRKIINDEINEKSIDELIDEQLDRKPEIFLLDETSDTIRHVIAPCCNPLPGDQVVGFQISNEVIEVHMTQCPRAIEQMSKFGNRIIKAKWRKEQDIAFLTGIRFTGFDRKGIIKEIIDIISLQLDLNIRSMDMSTKGDVFTGKLMLYVKNVKALNELIENLSKIERIEKIERIAPDIH